MNIHEAFPCLRVEGAAKAIDFYCRTYAAIEQFRLTERSGRIAHAQLTLGPITLMLSAAYPNSVCARRPRARCSGRRSTCMSTTAMRSRRR